MRHRGALLLLLLAWLSGCGDSFHLIAVLMDPLAQPDGSTMEHPNLVWARDQINAAGGVAGAELVLYHPSLRGRSIRDVAAEVAADDRFVAAIGPGGSQDLLDVADLFIAAHKPLVSFTSAAADVLRAYGGQGAIWRTRQSDIAQTEVLLRFARDQKVERVALLTSLDAAGVTFFSWFGFFAKEIGFADAAVHIGTLSEDTPCQAAVTEALKQSPQMVIVAAGSEELQRCAITALKQPMAGMPPRVVVADTGLDPYGLVSAAPHVEGFSAAGNEEYQAAFTARFPGARLAPHGAAEFDAVLLLAYGLAASGGQGGQALIDGMKAAVDGRDGTGPGWDAAGVAQALSLLRAGKRPLLRGATGPLRFEPQLYVDPASSTLAHWDADGKELVYNQRYDTSDPRYLVSGGALVGAGHALLTTPQDSSGWTPAVARGESWAVLAALSSGFSNYRHQADVLRQYQLLRQAGMKDDHIILIMADDIATSALNKAPGTVRNAPDGANLYSAVQRDYDLSVTGEDLANIIAGKKTARTPTVVGTAASSNLYVYLAGHGGVEGIPVGAETTEEGLSGSGAILTPAQLRDALCALRTEGRVRRGLVVIESCFSGAFGDKSYGGVERGCGAEGATTPLTGVVLMTAANSREVSYASGYDRALRVWVADAFSNQLATQVQGAPTINLTDLYTNLYLHVSGSHSSLFNSAAAGVLSAVTIDEFFRP